MFFATSLRALIVGTSALLTLWPESADAQFVRRYAGGGVAVRAPFVRVDVGPYGETSVRAPFVAVDDPGATYVGPGQRRRGRPGYGPGYYGQVAPNPQPARPLPTPAELAALDLPQLVQTFRELEATLQYELGRFDKAAGWQQYLAVPPEALGDPTADPIAVELNVLEKQLGRFDNVAAGGEFAKIAASPSFPATHEALRLVVERFAGSDPGPGADPGPGPAMVPPQDEDYSKDPGPVTESESEELPAPPPSPEPPRMQRSGERSILKK